MFPEQIKPIYIHQINHFDELVLGSEGVPVNTPGPARVYEERAYLLPGTVYVHANADRSILPWLADVGLSPNETIFVPSECVFRGLSESPEMLSEIAQKISYGASLHFFRTTSLEVELIRKLGLDWLKTLSCNPAIAEKIGNKAYLRCLAKELGYAKLFPPHVILPAGWHREDIAKAVWNLGSELKKIDADKVVIKRVDLAGGDGCCMWNNGCYKNYYTINAGHELIVEAFIEPSITITGQWLIYQGNINFIGIGKQYQSGFLHQGIVASSNSISVINRNTNRLKIMVEPILQHLVDIGYNGIVGFDAVYQGIHDRLYLTEANTRTTADTYVYSVASRLRFNPWAVACKIIKPALGIANFSDIKNALGYLLYRPARENGIVPYMLSGLKLPTGQRRMGLMSISTQSGTAEHFIREAEMRLC